MLKFLYTFQGIVEGDDTARTSISLYILQYIVGCKQSAVIACYYIPHNNLYAYMPKNTVLNRPYPSVWRTEQTGMQYLVGFLDIGKIGPGKMANTRHMIVGMIAYLMTALSYLLEKMRIFDGILTDHKEGCLGIKTVQGIEDKGGSLRDRAVIKSQVNGLLVAVHPPQGMWE